MWQGKAYRIGDDISTDHIIPGRWYHLRSNLPELAKHVLEDAEPGFLAKFRPGDFLVAGRNVGLGSSREHAPLVLKMAGVKAVLAASASRIFFRNAINLGMPLLICDTSRIRTGDDLELDLEAGQVRNVTRGETLALGRIPPVMIAILAEGGLIPYIKKYRRFQL